MGWLDFLVKLIGEVSGSPEVRQEAPPSTSTDPLFWGGRSPISKRIITEQVYDVAEHYFKDGVEFDEESAHWFVVPRYHLPFAWKGIAQTTSMMIVFPTEYPQIPPIGFYLKGDILRAPGKGHFYQQAYHEAAKAPLSKGWKWYCVYVNPGSWQPAQYSRPGDWKYGDNLWTYLTLVKEALSDTRE